MIVFVQLFILLIGAALRWRILSGKHLLPNKKAPHQLSCTFEFGPKNNKTHHVHHGIKQDCGVPFIVRHEKWYHVVLKFIGMAHELQVSDPTFNKKYFITTDYPEYLERLLASKRLMFTLQKMMGNPHFRALHATPHKIWLTMEGKGLDFSLFYIDSDFFYDSLKVVSEETSITESKLRRMLPKKRIGLKATLFISLHAGLLSLALLGVLPIQFDSIEMSNVYQWLSKGVILGLVAAVTWFFVILCQFKKTSWSYWVISDFILCGIVGFVLSGIFVVREANVHMPQAPAIIHIQPLINKECVLKCGYRSGGRRGSVGFDSSFVFREPDCAPSRRKEIMAQMKRQYLTCFSRASFRYKLYFSPWVPNRESYSFYTNAGVFDSMEPMSSIIEVPVHPGALGIEWVDHGEIKVKTKQ